MPLSLRLLHAVAVLPPRRSNDTFAACAPLCGSLCVLWRAPVKKKAFFSVRCTTVAKLTKQRALYAREIFRAGSAAEYQKREQLQSCSLLLYIAARLASGRDPRKDPRPELRPVQGLQFAVSGLLFPVPAALFCRPAPVQIYFLYPVSSIRCAFWPVSSSLFPFLIICPAGAAHRVRDPRPDLSPGIAAELDPRRASAPISGRRSVQLSKLLRILSEISAPLPSPGSRVKPLQVG